MTAPLLVLLCSSALGAYLAVQVRHHGVHWAWIYVPAAVNASVWIALTRSRTLALPIASSVFDVLVGTVALCVMVVAGERLTVVQCVGAALAMAGVGLMAR